MSPDKSSSRAYNDQSSLRIYTFFPLGGGISCVKSALGTEFDVRIGGVNGTLGFPQPPDWGDAPKDPLKKPLRPPIATPNWKASSQWGKPFSYPVGESNVKEALLYFDLPIENADHLSDDIEIDLPQWHSDFMGHLELITNRLLYPTHEQLSCPRRFRTFTFDEQRKKRYLHNDTSIHLSVNISDETYLTDKRLSQICTLTSRCPMSLEYQLLVASYRAHAEEDYRKALVEAAVAVEISLKNALSAKLNADGIMYADKLLDEFKMFGRLKRLANIAGVPLPSNLDDDLIRPRNNAVHRGSPVDKDMSLKALLLSRSLLDSNDPAQLKV